MTQSRRSRAVSPACGTGVAVPERWSKSSAFTVVAILHNYSIEDLLSICCTMVLAYGNPLSPDGARPCCGCPGPDPARHGYLSADPPALRPRAGLQLCNRSAHRGRAEHRLLAHLALVCEPRGACLLA